MSRVSDTKHHKNMPNDYYLPKMTSKGNGNSTLEKMKRTKKTHSFTTFGRSLYAIKLYGKMKFVLM